MSDNKDITKLPVVMLGSFGHAGIDWVHSLLDSHPEILIMPAFSFFRTLERIKRGNKLDINNSKNIEIAKTFSNTFFYDKSYQLKRRQFIISEIQKKKFESYLLKYLESSTEMNVKKKIFFGIHQAFVELYNVDLKTKKIIVIHEHVSWHCNEYKKLFNSKFLLVFRDPRATLAGGILRMRNSNEDGKINSFQLDTMILCMTSAYSFLKKDSQKKFIYPIINEYMHEDLQKEMSNLSKWLGISFFDSMLNQTFMNQKWLGESAYLAKDELKEEAPKNFYDPFQVEKRWRSILSPIEILSIEVVFRDMMERFGFKKDNNLNFLNRIKGYFNFYLMHQHQQKYYINKRIILLRNLLRRISALLLVEKTKFFFSFK